MPPFNGAQDYFGVTSGAHKITSDKRLVKLKQRRATSTPMPAQGLSLNLFLFLASTNAFAFKQVSAITKKPKQISNNLLAFLCLLDFNFKIKKEVLKNKNFFYLLKRETYFLASSFLSLLIVSTV